jgi:putative transcriptional regulator
VARGRGIDVKNRLRVLRAERNWSQAELAEALGVSRQTINAIEVEKYDPSLPLAFKMARLFGTRIEDIFSEADEDLDEPARA